MLKVGIIGAGGVARAHARALNTLKSAELVGVLDIDARAAESFTDAYGGTPVTDVDALLELADAVVVASPNFTHRDHSLSALRAGRSVLCEKPLALSRVEAKEMVAAAGEIASPALVGFNYRHLPVVTELRRRLQHGDFGTICAVELGFRKDSAYRRKNHTWRDSGRSNGTSGALGDLGVHLLDLLTYISGGRILVDECQARITTHVTNKSDEAVEVDDHAEIYGRLSTGSIFTLVASKAAPTADCGFSIRIVGTNAVFRYHTADPGRYLVSRGADTETVDLARTLLSDPDNEVHGWSDSFRSEIDHWSRLVAVGGGANRQALATFDDGFAAQEVLESLLRGSKPQPERLPVEHTLPTPAEL